ncbi:WD40-repeat-containing domain protein [Fimicolochytrium jonesii]|uniref:WD40-repeat-containing domain protein n=1 Tax=Fimicolochytrium jonesii TaxID=1396493 RepID=UPI0022FEDF72|nr:WD40-repeat-containing domain protein [Fimicolochytrium jonesii]KAI8819489.1 WD40-repeat-containing domain protein [Fimicolochytrium jonesii]
MALAGSATATLGHELSNPPTDGISSVKFSPDDPSLLLVGSWDKKLRLYDVTTDTLKREWNQKAATLDVCFSSGNRCFSVGVDKKLKSFDVNAPGETVIGSHDDAIRCVVHAPETGQILTGSWDHHIGLWDPRTNASLGKYAQPAKVFSMDVVGHTLVVATAGRSLFVYDIRNMKETLQPRESSLKFMTRVLRCMPNGEGFVSGSIEGRIAVEYFDPSKESQARKYAFKCHRQVVDDTEHIFPVNAIAFHPIHGTFASGGSDGVVYIWDHLNKKRMRQYPRYPTGISSLAFNCDGSMLAVASSYSFDEGEKDHPPDSVFVRQVGENECRSKAKVAA